MNIQIEVGRIRKVLMITYLFPPLFCGAGRQIKVAKYLPSFGWLPIVLTVKKSRLETRRDETRLEEIPDSVKICRTFTLESRLLQWYIPVLLKKFLGINSKWFQIPDTSIGWLPFALRMGSKIIRKEKIDLIFSTSLPNTNHLIGLILEERCKIPWVADFRDPWTQNPYLDYPKPVLKIEESMESAVIRNADKVTTINSFYTKSFALKYSDQSRAKFVTITHGFDIEDFQGTSVKAIDKFTITHVGTLYGLRRVTSFLEAISELVSENKNLKKDLKIKLIGRVGKVVKKVVQQRGLENIVEISGYVSHKKALEHLLGSSALLLVTGSSQEITGKLPEYLGVGKPILALGAKSGTAAKIIRSTGTGLTVHPDDKSEIKNTIRHFYHLYRKDKLKTEPDANEIRKYNVRSLTRKLSEIFDGAIKD